MDDEGFVVERGDEDLIIPPTTDENAIEKGKELSLWAALATCAVMYSVPYGFVRWNLHTLAPLLWYELGGATFLGTLMAMPFVAAIGYPAAKYELNMPILARSSFGIWGAEFTDACRATSVGQTRTWPTCSHTSSRAGDGRRRLSAPRWSSAGSHRKSSSAPT